MCRAARSIAPRAMKYARVSSSAVEARSVSPRTLLAKARPMAERAAVSQRTVRRAEPRHTRDCPRLERLINIEGVRIACDVHRRRDGGDPGFSRLHFERRHSNTHAQ